MNKPWENEPDEMRFTTEEGLPVILLGRGPERSKIYRDITYVEREARSLSRRLGDPGEAHG